MFQGKIEHTEESCLRLSLVQDSCFGRTRRAVRLVLSLIPVILGWLVGIETIWGILLCVLGLMLYFGSSGMYERDALKALRQTPEEYRKVSYSFHESDFTVSSGGVDKTVGYSQIYALADDGRYLYIFINPQQAYMLEPKSGEARKRDWFTDFLSRRTEKSWRQVTVREPFFNVMRKRLRASLFRR